MCGVKRCETVFAGAGLTELAGGGGGGEEEKVAAVGMTGGAGDRLALPRLLPARLSVAALLTCSVGGGRGVLPVLALIAATAAATRETSLPCLERGSELTSNSVGVPVTCTVRVCAALFLGERPPADDTLPRRLFPCEGSATGACAGEADAGGGGGELTLLTLLPFLLALLLVTLLFTPAIAMDSEGTLLICGEGDEDVDGAAAARRRSLPLRLILLPPALLLRCAEGSPREAFSAEL